MKTCLVFALLMIGAALCRPASEDESGEGKRKSGLQKLGGLSSLGSFSGFGSKSLSSALGGNILGGLGTAAKDVIGGDVQAFEKLFQGAGDVAKGDVFGALKSGFEAGEAGVKGVVGGVQALISGGGGANTAGKGTSGTSGFSFKL